MLANRLRPVILACITFTIFACSSSDEITPSDEKTPTIATGKASMESISAPLYVDNTVRFSAISNGCTNTADFSVEHIINEGRCELTVVRTKPDLCRKASELINIELEWPLPSNCTGIDVVFLNPALDPLQPGFERRLER